MSKVAQCDAEGIFVGYDDDYDGPMPHNCFADLPEERDGFVARRVGDDWEYIEDHRGKQGWIHGEHTEIKTPGPLPDGWSSEPPPPPPDTRTPEEKRRAAYRAEADPVREQIDGYRLEAEVWRMEGNEESARIATQKADALLVEYLAVKRDIRDRYPDVAG